MTKDGLFVEEKPKVELKPVLTASALEADEKAEGERRLDAEKVLIAPEVASVVEEADVRASAEEQSIVLTKDELASIIKGVVEPYTARIEAAEDRHAKLVLVLEMQDKKLDAVRKARGDPKPSGIKIISIDHGPPDHQGAMVKEHSKRLEGKHPRFCSTRPDIRSLRRAQGFEPILDEKGNEVRYMDGVLMAMPKEKHERTIVQPKRNLKEFRRRSIKQKFEDTGKAVGVETFGDITYDSVEEGEK